MSKLFKTSIKYPSVIPNYYKNRGLTIHLPSLLLSDGE